MLASLKYRRQNWRPVVTRACDNFLYGFFSRARHGAPGRPGPGRFRAGPRCAKRIRETVSWWPPRVAGKRRGCSATPGWRLPATYRR